GGFRNDEEQTLPIPVTAGVARVVLHLHLPRLPSHSPEADRRLEEPWRAVGYGKDRQLAVRNELSGLGRGDLTAGHDDGSQGHYGREPPHGSSFHWFNRG